MSASPNSTAFAAVLAASFTRPNDGNIYASGDLVANSTSAGSVVPLAFTNATVAAGTAALLRAVRIRKSGTGTTGATFRLHLFSTSPTSSAGDNAAFATTGSANMIARFEIEVSQAYADGANGRGKSIQGDDVEFVIPAGDILYGLLEARGAYTPAANETFEIVLELLRFTP